MRKHESPDRYWRDDVLVGEIPLPDGSALLRLRRHQSEEAYHGRNIAELISLSQSTGMRSYVHAKPYVLEPEITLTIGLSPTPQDAGVIGEVVDST
jgi:hypothetical protein